MMHVQCTLCSSLRFKLFIHHSIVYIQTVLTRTVPRPRRSCTARRAPHLGLPRLVCTARRAPHPGRRAPHPGPWTLPVIVRAKSGCCPSCARRMACAFVPATQQAALAELRHRRPWPGAPPLPAVLCRQPGATWSCDSPTGPRRAVMEMMQLPWPDALAAVPCHHPGSCC